MTQDPTFLGEGSCIESEEEEEAEEESWRGGGEKFYLASGARVLATTP